MRNVLFTSIAAVALAGGCAATGTSGPAAGPAQAQLARIAMDTRSFWFAFGPAGTNFVSSWQIDEDGTGLFRSIEWRRVGNIFRRRDVVRRIAVGTSGFRRIEALMRPAERHAFEGRIPCDEVPFTDSAHGSIAFTRSGVTRRIEYDQGCPTESARRIFDRVDEAEKVMAAWGAKGKIVRSERLPDRP